MKVIILLWIIIQTALCSISCPCNMDALVCNTNYCSCPTGTNIISIESFIQSSYYLNYLGDGSFSAVTLDYYDSNSDPNHSQTSFYFTSCKNTFGYTGDIRSIQPAYSTDNTNTWLYYNGSNLDIEIFNDLAISSPVTKNILFQNGTFVFVQNPFFQGTYGFQSLYYPLLYIRVLGGLITLGAYDGTVQFQQEASFVIHTVTPTPPVSRFPIGAVAGIIVGVVVLVAMLSACTMMIKTRAAQNDILAAANPIFDEKVPGSL